MATARITKTLPGMLRIRRRMEKEVVKNEREVGAPSVRQRCSNVPWKYGMVSFVGAISTMKKEKYDHSTWK